MAFRCVPYSWKICIRLAYSNIAFSCCIKRTFKSKSGSWVSLFTQSIRGSWTPSQMREAKPGGRGSELPFSCPRSGAPRPCPASMPLICLLPAPLPPRGHSLQTPGPSQLRPRLGQIVSTLGHTLAQQWDSRVTIYRSESSLEATTPGPTACGHTWPSCQAQDLGLRPWASPNEQLEMSRPPGKSPGEGTEDLSSE